MEQISRRYRVVRPAQTVRTTRQTKRQTSKTQSKSDHLNEIPDVGIECDLHHRDHRHILGETKREHNHVNIKKTKKNKQQQNITQKCDNDMSLRSIVVLQQNLINH